MVFAISIKIYFINTRSIPGFNLKNLQDMLILADTTFFSALYKNEDACNSPNR
jgi:hypothetical protein